MKANSVANESLFQIGWKNNQNISIFQETSLIKHGLGSTNITSIEEADQVNIKVDSNTLQYKNTILERNFKDYLQTDDEMKITREFKFNLVMFFLFYFLVVILILSSEIINLFNGPKNKWLSILSIVILSFLAILGILIYVLLIINSQIRQKSTHLLVICIILFQSYLIIFNEDLIKKTLDIKEMKELDNSLFICGTVYMSYLVLFSNYYALSIVCVYTSILYFLNHIMQKKEYYQSIFNIVILGYICTSFIINSYRTEKLMKVVYFLKCYNGVEDKKIQDPQDCLFIKQVGSPGIKSQDIDQFFFKKNKNNEVSEIDRIAIQLHKVKQYLVQCADLIMYSDIKKGLQEASKDLDYILKKILTQDDLFKIDVREFLNRSEITDEDKAFVLQNYLDPAKDKSNPLQIFYEARKRQRKKTTFVQNIENNVVVDQIMPEINSFLCKVGKTWNLDIFFLASITENKSITTVANFIFNSILEVTQIFKIQQEVYQKYFKNIEQKYQDNPYHNRHHATDITLSMLFFIFNSKLKENLDNLDMLSCIIATMGHDVSHPGLNNRFLVNNQEELALVYNDVSVLENMHCSVTFKEMKMGNFHLLQSLKSEYQQYVRKLVVEMILETDMSKHFDSLAKFKAKTLNLVEFSAENSDDKFLILKDTLAKSEIYMKSEVKRLLRNFFYKEIQKEQKGLLLTYPKAKQDF